MKKSKRDDHPVDQYLKQSSARIPITFDDRHWEALTAMLDATSTPPAGTPSPKDAKGYRAQIDRNLLGTVLLLVSLIGILSYVLFGRIWDSNSPPATLNTISTQKDNIHQQSSKPINVIPDESPRLSPANSALNPGKGPHILSENKDSTIQEDFQLTIPSNQEKVDSSTILPIKVLPAPELQDSIELKKKKKKHLFW